MLAKSISYITPFTLLDYPHKSACILWYVGCNMRCLYCYNPEIVLGKGTISFVEVKQFLHKRKGLLDAVVFSGGECLIHKNIVEHIRELKELGFKIKVDTNGSKPSVLKQLLEEKLVDYIALDFKSLPKNFENITKSNLFKPFEDSFKTLLNSSIDFEIRTTYHSDLISVAEINEMIAYLTTNHYTGNYYIQQFKNDVKTLGDLPNSYFKLSEKLNNSSSIPVIFR